MIQKGQGGFVMKKLMSLLLSLVMLFGVVSGVDSVAFADEPDTDIGWQITGKCGENVAYSFDETTGEVVINGSGDMYNNYNTYTNKSPFYSNSKVKSVVISDGVTSVANLLFGGCKYLGSVTLGSDVALIGANAFNGCTSLTKIELPSSVTTLSEYAFKGCTNLKIAVLSNKLQSIGYQAFASCSNLTGIDIPDSVTFLGSEVFYNCSKLTSVKIGNNVPEIRSNVFYQCAALENLSIGNSVSLIDEYAFYGCSKLKDFVLPDGVATVGKYAFAKCSSLTKLVLPDSVTSVGERAFFNCTGLLSANLGATSSIGLCAFIGCSNLASVTFGNGISDIQPNAFYNCSALNDVYYSGSKEQWSGVSVSSGNECLENASFHFGIADSSALEYLKGLLSGYSENDYSGDSYADLIQKLDFVPDDLSGLNQDEIDSITRELLESASALKPYLEFLVSASNGSYSVSYDTLENVKNNTSVLYGTEITLTAKPDDGYKFAGWYDEFNNLYFSKDETYSFKLTANTRLKAVFVKNGSATLTFKTYTDWVKSSVTKTADEWQSVTSIADLLPEVPYRYGYSNGRWVYDETAVLAKLQAGEDVAITPEYDKDSLSLPTVPAPSDSIPALDLYYNLDEENSVGSFVLALGVPENCKVESTSTLFYYKEAGDFDPTAFTLFVNNKMTASRFNTGSESGICIANIKNLSSRYNWSARGCVSYYDANGDLQTAYSNQINIVARQQV